MFLCPDYSYRLRRFFYSNGFRMISPNLMLILLFSHDHKLLIIHLVEPNFFFLVISLLLKGDIAKRFFFSVQLF